MVRKHQGKSKHQGLEDPGISFFRRVSRFIGVSRHLALQKGKSSVYWHATLSCLSWPQIMQKFVSRSDLVLDADQALDFSSDLAFQACISFYSVLYKSGALMFLPCSIKNAVAHI